MFVTPGWAAIVVRTRQGRGVAGVVGWGLALPQWVGGRHVGRATPCPLSSAIQLPWRAACVLGPRHGSNGKAVCPPLRHSAWTGDTATLMLLAWP